VAARPHRPVFWGLLVLGLICLGPGAFILFRTAGVQMFSIPSRSMEPTLLPGDYIAVNKSAYGYSHYSLPFSPPLFSGRILAAEPKRGDLVVFRLTHTDLDYVKRIVGLPGDRIQMRGGELYINHAAVKRERAPDFAEDADQGFPLRIKRWRETLPNGVSYETIDLRGSGFPDDTQEFTVPPGNYFVLGDNRDNSLDSRMPTEFGYVPAENLIGRIMMIVYSAGSDGVPRTDRIGLEPK
jgi:signal peptidase I